MNAYDLRYYQKEAFDAVINALTIEKINPLVDSAAGTGKSVMIASVIAHMAEKYPAMKILCLANNRVLVGQNQKKLKEYAGIHAGINCAGLKRNDILNRIIFASIGSIANKNKLRKLGMRHLILVDEPHTIPDDPNSMYRKVITHFKSIYPTVKIVGYTATPYRLVTGRLDEGEGRIFDRTVYTYSIKQGVADGYLSPLISKVSLNSIDLSRAKKSSSGEIKLDSIENEAEAILEEAINEIIELGEDREKWILFTPSVKYCNVVATKLNERGIRTNVITADTKNREAIIQDYKDGKIRALVNVDVLTTGFDVPAIDMIVMLRPTYSTSLYVQMLGRGTRLHNGKENCLVVDYAGNIRRHGPVDEIVVKTKKKKEKTEDTKPITKMCPGCEHLVAPATLTCPHCGFEWDRSERIGFESQAEADFGVMSCENHPTESRVCAWTIHIFNKTVKPPSLLITFKKENLHSSKEWLAFEGKPFAKKMAAKKWLKLGGQYPIPLTTTEAFIRQKELNLPYSIIEQVNGKYINVVDYKIMGE